MHFWLFCLSVLSIIGCLGFLKRRQYLLMTLCLLIAIVPTVASGRKIHKLQLRKELKKNSHITLNGESGYCDVSEWIRIRTQLKSSLHYKKERQEHLRLADIDLDKPPLGEAFEKLLADPPEWMIDQVQKEFSSFKRSKSNHLTFQTMLEDLQQVENWQEEFLLAKYKIQDGRLYVKDYSNNHNTLKYMNGALVRLLRSVALPDMEFLLSLHDTLDLYHTPLPIFVHCKFNGNPYMIVIPDHESLIGFDYLNRMIDEASENISWEEKEDTAFWRGSTTSGNYSLPNWREYPRSKLVFLGLDHPELIDAKFTNLVLGAQDNQELKATPGIFADFIYPEDHLKYRYLIDVDGNVSTYSRLYWILRSNSTAIKHNSPYVMWFYPILKPFLHYIPVEYDLKNMPEQIQWARSHPEISKLIAEYSTRLIKEEVTIDHAYLYLYLVLQEYANLFHGD